MDEVSVNRLPGEILAHLESLRGQPVRITLLDAASRERAGRVHGVLTVVRQTGLTVECVDSVPGTPEGAPLALEAMTRGLQTWFHTNLAATARPGALQLQLALPQKVQTIQRRQFPRVDFHARVHLVVKATGRVVEGALRDLSAGGASIRLSGEVGPGEIVQLMFSLGSGLFFESLTGEILRCHRGPDGSSIVGMRFQCSAEQQALLAQWVNERLSS
ncbi:MAG: PilZ domain-containing protein [Bacillota bacterium]